MSAADATGRAPWAQLGRLFRAHPWHGLPIGPKAPWVVTAYIEILPTDTVKYELDKASGYVKIDRPQKFSSLCPTLYGLIPQTLCAGRVGALSAQRTGRAGLTGDLDPLDICVLAERPISHSDILLQAIPIGGLRVIDGDEADDKIIAVMQDDAVYGGWTDVAHCPPSLIRRLSHYFLTYKELPGADEPRVEIAGVYGRDEAHGVIVRSREDYRERYGDLERLLAAEG